MPSQPEGFRYEPNLLSPEEERALIEQFGTLDLKPFHFHGYEGNRRVVSFGHHYDFSDQKLKQTRPIPEFLLPLRAKAGVFASIASDDLSHVLITEYAPGAGIGWHRDKSVFGDVIGVSFASACRFRFRRQAGKKWERAEQLLEPRSIYLMRGASRTEWEHSIPAGEELRYSVTFRTLRQRT